MSKIEAGLSIGTVASQTNLSVATLRAWEQRHGFPTPERLPSGHRRFRPDDVEQIRHVLRDRDAGMSLEAAIRRVRAASDRSDLSIFAGLRRHRELPAHVLSHRAMLAVSRAIEDECCAQAERPVLIGSFERERFYRASERRWRELSRTAAAAIVLADFRTNGDAGAGVAPNVISLPADALLLREWAVVCDAPDAAACLAGVERTSVNDERHERRFEAVWSVDPVVVRDATELALTLARGLDASVDDQLDAVGSQLRARAPADPAATLGRATALTNRVVAYLDL